MTISSLLTYLNAAMPPDKHEDFDTSEVVKAVAAFKEKGKVIFEGDTLRLCMGIGICFSPKAVAAYAYLPITLDIPTYCLHLRAHQH
ncbi:hypothetical protein PLEOSDRAFT_1077315 [Pleurotus ostreatus PC15]|uniref:Uncharacterized protein n=1 Tax=Pleurotus ostreatus (strain PC15) TaxID=1137138 RepID=A0A067NE26_PLEO1|nr:hypothetical protein PLEOSDRAFT_1077315 [Pleurotus ostreatus PC15]